MSEWTTIFRDAVPRHAGVTVYDKGNTDCLGRYVVAKLMKLASGRTKTTQSYYVQRPAALRYARKFLAARASMANLAYSEGDGAKTLAGYQEEAK